MDGFAKWNYRFKEKNGHYGWFLGRVIPSKDSQGNVKKWYGTCTDIHDQKLAQTERKNLLVAAQAAEAASKLKSQFVANMSHEIRTPLNGIIGMINILQRSQLSKEQADCIRVISESSSHLRAVANDVLDLSKIESNQLHLDLGKFNLRDIAKKVFSSLRISAKSKNIKFRFLIPKKKNLNLVGDSIRVKQVLINLVQNAVKFTHEGHVEVRIRIQENEKKCLLCVDVEDTGIGIAESSLDHVFTAFTQADNTITRKFGGTGLGLSICRKLIDMMNGEISVQSTLGKGSTFSFSVPFERADFNLVVDNSPQRIFKPKRSLSVLVAEDNEINQKVICKTLNFFGHVCEIANNGEEALLAYNKGDFDIILMDYHMPKMDGLTAIKMIRKINSEKASVPIIALTADALEETRKKCLDSGANEFISKTVVWEDLFHAIEKVASKKASPQLIDLKIFERLKEISAGDNFLWDLTSEYCLNTKLRISALIDSLKGNDLKAAFHIAHAIKSSSGQLGAVAIQKEAIGLERACELENLTLALLVTENLKKTFVRTQKSFEGLKKI